MDETMLSSLANAPATPPLKLTKQQQQSTTKPTNNDLNSLSTPKLRPSGKNLLSFRSQTPIQVNPIVALHNDPSVQLTSFRKFDQDQTPRAVENSSSPAVSLFPCPSDSEIISSANSSRFHKHASRYSLPEAPFQRSQSATSAPTVDSPIIPEFLCPSPEKLDDVFIANDQEKLVAASTFGDSSMKSKVLQASFRGKASTMDRRTAATTPFRSQSTSVGEATKKAHTGYTSRPTNTQPRYFVTKSNNPPSNGPVKCSLDSVLNLTLQFEQTSTADYQRRHTISVNDIDPLLLNGLTDDENQLNHGEKSNGHHLAKIEEKQEASPEYDRIQNQSSVNGQTIQ